MLQQWRELLEETGAEFVDDKLVSYGNLDGERGILPQGDVVCDLSHIGIIRVSGEEAEDFLQNQLTNDIRYVNDTHRIIVVSPPSKFSEQVTEQVKPAAQLSAWCNPKGRVIATLLIHKRQGSYYLTLSADLMEYVLKRLQMYVMRSKVVLEDVTESLVHFGFTGSHIIKGWDSSSDGELPVEDYGMVVAEDLSIIKIPGDLPRYEVVGELEDATRLWKKINNNATPVNADAWNYLNISSGIPVVSQASMEDWIPQMLNLQLIGGVNFKKGCFPGQEVVARLKYLGKNKRRAFRLEIATGDVPEVGELIVAEGEKAEAGKVLNAVLNPDGKVEALAILKIAMADKRLFLGSEMGASAQVLELPFTVEE